MPPAPAAAGTSYHDGAHCYFKHPKDSWVLAQIVGKSDKGYNVKTTDTERSNVGESFDGVKDDDLTTCREDLLDEQPNDLLSLTVLHDATLLRCLYLRYFKDIIYTNIGAIVVAINPFNFKIPWYMDDKMPQYLEEGSVIEKNLPHSWAQAHNTYNEMVSDGENQCILISGESGAGKTEATKIVMKYLAQISCKRGSDEEKKAGLQVGAKLNSCSPILECFGNARTVRNDNSSRFGKFMKVKFSKNGQVVGAETTKYLLEKSRIVTAAENERVYHSFYVVTRGWLASQLKLESDKAYTSINSGKCLHNSEFDTPEDFKEVTDAMMGIGMSKEDVEGIWSCVGGILSMQNVTFKEDGEGSLVSPETEKYLKDAVRLMKIDEATLRKELVTTTLVIQNQETVKLLRPTLAADIRDALSKALYDGMFGWLVDKSNELCDVPEHGNWIGLLDIFGFEDFQKNSFEQLCINLANETLQHHYNGFIFDKDMQECRAEGIDVTEVKCPDNTPCLKLITDKGGVLALLDEECLLGKGTEFEFLEKVTNAHSKNTFFTRIKTSKEFFVIHHYAASVKYDVIGWLDKNRDTLKDNVKTMMRNSQDALIKQFLEAPLPPDVRQKKLTVGAFFKGQVSLLMEVINSTNPHWIRCIKPHPAKKARMFDGVQTMNQLESSGVLGTVKIRKAGYPVRMIFDKFNVRYRILVGDQAAGKSSRDLAALILKTSNMMDKDKAQLGKTKVFMKSEALPVIEKMRNEALLKYAKIVERCGRGFIARVQTCKDNIQFKQKRMVQLLQEEYRAYVARSANIREARAKWRREQEELYGSAKREIEAEYRRVVGALYEETVAECNSLCDGMKGLFAAFREHAKKLQVARDDLMAREEAQRKAIFDAACAYVEETRELYRKERILFAELLLVSLCREEEEARRAIEKAEREGRNFYWGHHAVRLAGEKMRKSMNIVVTLHTDLMAYEGIQRQEIMARMNLERSYYSRLRAFRRQMKEAGLVATEQHRARRKDEGTRNAYIGRLQDIQNGERRVSALGTRQILARQDAIDGSSAENSARDSASPSRSNGRTSVSQASQDIGSPLRGFASGHSEMTPSPMASRNAEISFSPSKLAGSSHRPRTSVEAAGSSDPRLQIAPSPYKDSSVNQYRDVKEASLSSRDKYSSSAAREASPLQLKQFSDRPSGSVGHNSRVRSAMQQQQQQQQPSSSSPIRGSGSPLRPRPAHPAYDALPSAFSSEVMPPRKSLPATSGYGASRATPQRDLHSQPHSSPSFEDPYASSPHTYSTPLAPAVRDPSSGSSPQHRGSLTSPSGNYNASPTLFGFTSNWGSSPHTHPSPTHYDPSSHYRPSSSSAYAAHAQSHQMQQQPPRVQYTSDAGMYATAPGGYGSQSRSPQRRSYSPPAHPTAPSASVSRGGVVVEAVDPPQSYSQRRSRKW